MWTDELHTRQYLHIKIEYNIFLAYYITYLSKIEYAEFNRVQLQLKLHAIVSLNVAIAEALCPHNKT